MVFAIKSRCGACARPVRVEITEADLRSWLRSGLSDASLFQRLPEVEGSVTAYGWCGPAACVGVGVPTTVRLRSWVRARLGLRVGAHR
ncbi:hypothetical protein [Actinocorallia aurea]